MSQFAYCSVCGKAFLKPPQPLYKCSKAQRTVYQCSYTCWQEGKELPAEKHFWLARLRMGDTFSALYIKNNQDALLKEKDAFICEFNGRRWLLLKQFVSCLLYTLENNDGNELLRISDLHFVSESVQITFISNILNRKSTGAIENLLREYNCSELT